MRVSLKILKLVSSDQGLEIDNNYPHSKIELTPPTHSQQRWRAIPSSDFILNDVVSKLKHSRDYKVLKHIAWIQPVVDHKNAQSIKIQGGRNLGSEYPERLPAYPQNKRLNSRYCRQSKHRPATSFIT